MQSRQGPDGTYDMLPHGLACRRVSAAARRKPEWDTMDPAEWEALQVLCQSLFRVYTPAHQMMEHFLKINRMK